MCQLQALQMKQHQSHSRDMQEGIHMFKHWINCIPYMFPVTTGFYRQNHATSTSIIDAWSSPLAHPHLDLHERKPFGTSSSVSCRWKGSLWQLTCFCCHKMAIGTTITKCCSNRGNSIRAIRKLMPILLHILSLKKEDLPGTPLGPYDTVWSWHGGCNDHRMCPTKSLFWEHTRKIPLRNGTFSYSKKQKHHWMPIICEK